MSKYTDYYLVESAVRAIRNSDTNKIKYYIEKGFNFNEELPTCDYPFGIACYVGNLEIVELLLKNGCEAYCYRSYKDTPLHYAAEGGNLKVVKLLINLGHKVNARNCGDRTPLDTAKYHDKADVVEYLEFQEEKQKLKVLAKNFDKVDVVEYLELQEEKQKLKILAKNLEEKERALNIMANNLKRKIDDNCVVIDLERRIKKLRLCV